MTLRFLNKPIVFAKEICHGRVIPSSHLYYFLHQDEFRVEEYRGVTDSLLEELNMGWLRRIVLLSAKFNVEKWYKRKQVDVNCEGTTQISCSTLV